MAKQKYYVVWNGAEDGIFTSWEACQKSVSGYPNAKFKAFKTEEEAEAAYEQGPLPPSPLKGEKGTEKADTKPVDRTPPLGDREAEALALAGVSLDAIAVDAACSGNPGTMEYRGVYLRTGKVIFHSKAMYGTNNIGEFLAIVHALALLKQKGLNTMTVYSDSVNAQLWVRKRQCKTTLPRDEKTQELFAIIDRAEAWLRNNTYSNPVVKWRTDEWGEIPADFGRK